VFAEHGFDARVIDLVIRQAEVSRGTFYNHFNTIEELFTALAQAVSDEILMVVDPMVLRHDDPAIRLACGIRLSVALVRRHPILARFLVRGGVPALTVGSLTTETIPREVRAGITAGRFSVPHERLGFDLVLGSVMAAFHTLLTMELPEDYPQDLAQAVLQSLGVEPAEAHRCARVELDEVDLPEDSLLTCKNTAG
jgi:AcrR family transcriptional regulator